MATHYRRTPLPRNARTPLTWLAVWFFLLLFSPFFGFAIHGKVDETGLVIGFAVGVAPFVALVFIAVRSWHGIRHTPQHIRDEWRLGRLVAAEDAPLVSPPIRFEYKKNWIELRAEGIVVSNYSFLGMHGTKQAFKTSWIARQSEELFVPWSDVAEWIVDSDTEGPDYYRLKLHPQGELKVRRFEPEMASESKILDAVRSIGKLPVRLKCDVE